MLLLSQKHLILILQQVHQAQESQQQRKSYLKNQNPVLKETHILLVFAQDLAFYERQFFMKILTGPHLLLSSQNQVLDQVQQENPWGLKNIQLIQKPDKMFQKLLFYQRLFLHTTGAFSI